MNKLILCEGKSDAILLSYYLDCVCGWQPCRRVPKGLNIQADEHCGESCYWYQRDGDYLLICGVGGKDKFTIFFQKKILHSITDSSAFQRVAVITDHDDRNEADIIHEITLWMKPIAVTPIQNTWVKATYRDGFEQLKNLDFLLLIIPADKEGELETVLLDAISEDPYDCEIVNRSKAFVEDILPYAGRYIHKRRLKAKARLGVTWAIQSPEKEFHFIDEQIREIHWESSTTLKECFCHLIEI